MNIQMKKKKMKSNKLNLFDSQPRNSKLINNNNNNVYADEWDIGDDYPSLFTSSH